MELAINEMFSLPTLGEYTDLDLDIFDDGVKFYNEAVAEATSTPVTKEGVTKRIWEFLKKIWNWITTAVKQICSTIGKVFKKKTKSVDQILMELGVVSKTDVQEGTIKFAVNDESFNKLEEKDIKLALKPYLISFTNDSDEIYVTVNQALRGANYYMGVPLPKELRFGKVTGHHRGSPLPLGFLMVIALMNNPDKMDSMKAFADEVASKTFTSETISNFNDTTNWLLLKAVDFPTLFKPKRVTLTQLTEFQEFANYINEKIQSISDPNERYGLYAQVINNFSSIATSLQIGLNLFTDAIRNVYTIDITYCESISDVDALGKFINTCIENNMPGKYLALNASLISSPKLKGNGDALKPVWGQSRVVFFPTDPSSVIYKIALSKLGVNSNIAEYQIYKKFESVGEQDVLARVEGVTEDNCVLTMERVNTKAVSRNPLTIDLKVANVVRRVEEVSTKHSIPINISADIHKDNIGARKTPDGKVQLVAIDYGAGSRRW